MNSKVNAKLEALRRELEVGLDEEGTPQYTKVIKPSGSPKAIDTAKMTGGETPEYEKQVKPSGSAKALPTPKQSKPPSSRPGGLAGESLNFYRRMSGLPKRTQE